MLRVYAASKAVKGSLQLTVMIPENLSASAPRSSTGHHVGVGAIVAGR